MTPMRVRVLDGETGAISIPAIDWADLRERNNLTDADGDELRRTGRLWIGGGAAPLYLVMLSSQADDYGTEPGVLAGLDY